MKSITNIASTGTSGGNWTLLDSIIGNTHISISSDASELWVKVQVYNSWFNAYEFHIILDGVNDTSDGNQFRNGFHNNSSDYTTCVINVTKSEVWLVTAISNGSDVTSTSGITVYAK